MAASESAAVEAMFVKAMAMFQRPKARTVYDLCSAKEGSAERRSCELYVVGFVDGVVGGKGREKKGFICLTRYLTPYEARGLFLRVLRTHPELMNAAAGPTMAATLANSFPCKS
ncbi:MAG: hypothetical protein JO056_00870 [Alphaproteobacteria bacterium]|nr:hypothetical protein [Alphaproteobacteria bacterium]